MDLALINLQRLICHKTQTTNQPIFTAQSAETIKYADCISAEGKTLPVNGLDMILNF